MKRLSIGQATAATMLAEGVLALGTLLVTPLLLGRVGRESYAIISVVSLLAGQLSVLHLGIGPAATRRVAECRAPEQQADPRARLATLWATVVLASAAALLVAGAFVLLGDYGWRRRFHASPAVLLQARQALPAAVLIAAEQPLIGALFGILQGDERFGACTLLRLLHLGGRLLLSLLVVLLYRGPDPVVGLLWSQAFFDGAMILVLGFVALEGRWPDAPAPLRLHAARALLGVGLHFALTGLVGTLLADGEKLAISAARPLEDLTFYAVPYNAAFRLTVLGGALSGVLLPRLSMTSAAEAARLCARATRLTVALMSAVITPLCLLAPEWLHLWLGPAFARASARPTRILLCAMLINTSVYAAHAVLRARARPALLSLLFALELPLHLLFVYAAVRGWGISGAALAWALRAALDAAAQFLLARRCLERDPCAWAVLLVPAAGVALLSAACEVPGLSLGARLVCCLLVWAGVLRWLLQPEDLAALRRLWPTPGAAPPGPGRAGR